MDDDARRRVLQTRSGNVGQVSSGPSHVPSFLHALDPISGKLTVRMAQGVGVDFLSDQNSMPRIASISENNGYVLGGNFQKDLAVPDIRLVAGKKSETAVSPGMVDFLKLDPNVAVKPGGDVKGARGRDSVAIFPG